MRPIIKVVQRLAPKQSEIVDYLLRRIISGELPPGSRIPSLNEMTIQFRTTANTAQLAVNRLRQEGYVTTVQGKGKYVADNPPHLTNFGLVFEPEPQSSRYLEAWQKEAERANAHPAGSPRRRVVTYCMSDRASAIKAHEELVAALRACRLAGLIFPLHPLAFAGTPVLDEPDVPRVTVADVALPDVHCIRLEPVRGKMLDYLARHGRRRIASLFISVPWDTSGDISKLIEEASARGMVIKRHWVQGVSHYPPCWAANCAELLMRCDPSDRPDALMIMDENLVPAATAGLLAAGVRVPEDVLVVARTSFPYPTPSAVPAKRIGYNIREMLGTCLNIIDRCRRGGNVPQVTVAKAYWDDELQASFGEANGESDTAR